VVGVLKYRNFRLFFFGQGISLIGTWMQQVAMIWLVYRLTNSPFLLGLVGFCSQIPSAASQHDFGIANMETPAIMRRILKQ
jgi:hypothetical protein